MHVILIFFYFLPIPIMCQHEHADKRSKQFRKKLKTFTFMRGNSHRRINIKKSVCSH